LSLTSVECGAVVAALADLLPLGVADEAVALREKSISVTTPLDKQFCSVWYPIKGGRENKLGKKQKFSQRNNILA
jgi:hypothetical protein